MAGKAGFLDFRPSLYFLSLTDATVPLMMSKHQVIHRTKQHGLFLTGVWGLCLESANWNCFCFCPCLYGWLTYPAVRPLLTSSYAPGWVFHSNFNLPEKSSSIMASPWAAASFRKCWPALLWHPFLGLQGNVYFGIKDSFTDLDCAVASHFLACSPCRLTFCPLSLLSVSLAGGLLFGLRWVWYGTSCVQHRALPVFSERAPLQLLPKLCHVNPIQMVRQGSTLWVSIAASAMVPWIAKLPAELAMVLLLKVPPTWSSHVSQTGYALKSPASVLVKAAWMSRRGSMWFCCERWQCT